MDPTALPLPTNLPSADNWRADLDTWHDKFVLVDPSGLLFFETQRREYSISPVPWVRHSSRYNVTSENTAFSGRPSESFRRKSCPFPNEASSTLTDVTKAEPSNSTQIDEEERPLQPEVLKSNKRRKVENSFAANIIPPRPTNTASVITSNLISVKKSVKNKFDWRRYKKGTAQLPPSKVDRKRPSDTFDAAPSVPAEHKNPALESLRVRLGIPPDVPVVCSVCSTPSLINENWRGCKFGKLACQGCAKFVENSFIYTVVKTVPACVSGLRNCSVHYTNKDSCRFCRLRKCLEVWPPESLPLHKYANAQVKEIWLSQRRHLIQGLSEPVPEEPRRQKEPICSPLKQKTESAPVVKETSSRKSSRAVRSSEPVIKEEQAPPSNEDAELTTRRSTRPGRGSKMTDIIGRINAPTGRRSRQQFADDASVASSSKDVTDTSNAALADFEMGDFVIERTSSEVEIPVEQPKQSQKTRGGSKQRSKPVTEPILAPDDHVVDIVKPEQDLPEKSPPSLETSSKASSSIEAAHELGDFLWCAAPKPRAAALAASAAIRTQNAEHSRRTSLTPKKETLQESAEPVPSLPKKQRRTVGGVQQQKILVASLKSVKPTKMKGKEIASKKVTPPRRNSNESRPSVLDSPEYVPPVTDELKTSSGHLKADCDKKPRIKHVFRHPSSTFLARNSSSGNLASGNSPPGQNQPPVAGKTGPPPGSLYHSRSPTPPPPLTAPIRITSDKLPNKPGKFVSNEVKKPKKSAGAVISPTRSNQQLKATRCNRCPGCRLADCGKCRFCLDMPKFGGSGQLHHACERRVCQFQDRLQEFTYRRIKLPTIQLPSAVPPPVAAVKEASIASSVPSDPKSPLQPIMEPSAVEKAHVLLTPPANNQAEVAAATGSLIGSTEMPRRSSPCSDGIHCGSPIPNCVLQSPVMEEIVVSNPVKQEQQPVNPPPVLEQQKSEEELVDVSSLKPILSEFEPLPPLLACSETRRRRVCAAILEDVSLERALNEGMAVVTTASLMPAIRALCLLCGSAGREPMLFCQLCAHPFHTFCLSMFDDDSVEPFDLSKVDLSNWLCPSCQYCELCQQPSALNNKLARCTKCRFYFHPSCLAPNYPVPKKKTKSIWVCSRCVKCEDCGATHPGRGINAQWSSDFKHCQSCSDARGQNFCPECLERYAADDFTLRMLQCHRCDAWIHANPCAGLTDDLYDLFEFLPDSVNFVCLKCAKKLGLHRPLNWELRAHRLLADRLGEMMALFVQHTQGVVDALTEETVSTEDTVQCQLSVDGIDNEETKDVMQAVCEGLVKASYREVSAFVVDFWNVLKVRGVKLPWLTDLLLSFFTGMNPAFKKRVRRDTLARIEEKKEVPAPPVEVVDERKAKKEAEKKKKEEEQEEKKKKAAASNKQNEILLHNLSFINLTSEDTRMCRLCCRFGDGDPQEAGRLLYAGQDEWVHVNCALWSAEVFEKGSLLCNVTQALCRSRHLKCFYCGRTGATLQCREQGCRMDFHFMCAREHGHSFTEEHHCYCPEHTVEESSDSSEESSEEEEEKEESSSEEESSDEDEIAYISDFAVDRRLICDPDSIRWRRNWLDGFNSQDITVVVGSISVLRLGSICELSDVKHVLVPLQYAIERVHWDVDDPSRLRVYRCTVDAVQSPHFDNPNSAAITTAFRTPGKVVEEVEVAKKTPELPVCDPVVPVPVPPLPEPVPSPEPVKRTLNFDDDVPSHRFPLVVFQGAEASWNTFEPATNMPPPPSPPVVAKPTASPKLMTPSSPTRVFSDLNHVRRLIDASPRNEPTTAALMRTVRQQSSMSPRRSESLSRIVPFEHQKPTPSPSLDSLVRFSPPRPVRPNIPPPPEPEQEIEVETEVPVVEPASKPLVASEAVAVPTNNGVFVPVADPDILSVVDHVVSRVAFEDGDFSRHGASLSRNYTSPQETTLHLLRTASGINGKTIVTAAANDLYSSTMLNKYKVRTKNRNQLGPKPMVCGPSPTSGIVPIILNHSHSKMNQARPPEMDLFPVSIFPAPRFGLRAKRHFDVMQQANEAILSELKVEQKAVTPIPVPQLFAKPVQQIAVTSVVRPQVQPVQKAPLVNGTTVKSVTLNGPSVSTRTIPIARLSLVTGTIRIGNGEGSGPRILSVVRPVGAKPVGPQIASSVPQPQPRFSLTSAPVNQKTVTKVPIAGVLAAQPPQRVAPPVPSGLLNKMVINSSTNRAVMSVSGPMGPMVKRSLPDVQVPVKTVATASPRQPLPPVTKLKLSTPPFLNISLPPISPVTQRPYAGKPTSVLSPPKMDGISSKFTSPGKVRFQDVNPLPQKVHNPTPQPKATSACSVPSDTSVVKKKRKEAVKKRDISSNLLPGDDQVSKKAKSQISDKKSITTVVKRPKTPLSLATLLPKSPLKACLPTTELALAEIVNRVVTESVLFDDAKAKPVAGQRKQQRYLVFEITPSDQSDQTWKIRGFTWQDSWRVLFSRLSAARQSRGLTQLGYDSLSGLSLLGLTQSSVVALIEQLPGVEEESSAYMFRFARYERTAPNPAGCVRAQPYAGNWCPGQRRHRDVFSFLLSAYRRPKVRTGDNDQEQASLTASMAGSSNGLVSWEVSRAHKTLRRPTALLDLPLPTRLRYLRETARYDVGVFRSTIHARGLYALRNFEAQEMIIEYAGELIRATLTDKRERMYERQGIGCYMFRLDEFTVIDATRRGNAGRFINHCCEPNCYSRVIVGYEGLKHIVIFALRPIAAGEELTYDYKFPIEDAASKIPCYCGARRCRKYLN